MKLSVRHEFACTPDEYWQCFWDPALDAAMQARTGVQRTLLAERDDGKSRYGKYSYKPDKTLPTAAAKVLGTDRLTYEQENHFDPATQTLRWKVIPVVMADKIRAEGTATTRPTPAGCERTIEGIIEVKIPFLGGKIEQAIVDEVLKSYENAAATTRDFLAARRNR